MQNLILEHPWNNPNAKSIRRNWRLKEKSVGGMEVTPPCLEYLPPIIYECSKLTHNGIVGYKSFENCSRRLHHNSLSNLLSSVTFSDENLEFCVNQYRACQVDQDRTVINNQAVSLLNQVQFDKYLQLTHQTRYLNAQQSRKVKNMADKLAYYSQTRKFKSKKSGSYNFRIAFLTLTAPEGSDPGAILKAFDRFLDYIQRTANCHYVWKKELGEKSHHLHFHMIINNFIPYYIVSWKWQRCLLAEGVNFPVGPDGKFTNAHTRIELPRSAKEVNHYIAKYLSKAYEIPGKYGYISGHSSILSKLKEIVVSTGDKLESDIRNLFKYAKIVRREYVTLLFTDLLKVKDICPNLFAAFEEQYLRFSTALTLPQKFFST